MPEIGLRSVILAVCSLLCLTGCATPSPNADYGSYPTNYEENIKTMIANSLLDPESGRFRIGSPVQGYMTNALIHGAGVYFTGYLVPVEVNGKNRFGGYVGAHPYFCLVRNSEVFNCFPGNYQDEMFAHVVR